MTAVDSIEQALQDFQSRGTPRNSPQEQFSALRQELRGYAAEMKSLYRKSPDEAMAWLSSVSARILEMILMTTQNDHRAATKFRVEELIPVRDETRYQWQVASRRHSISQLDWEVAGGQAS